MKYTHLNISLILLLLFVFSVSAKAEKNILQSSNIVDGYMDKQSYNPGDTARIYINATGTFSNYKIFLQNVNDAPVDSLIVNIAPQAIVNALPYQNGYGYSVSFTYVIPDLQSGIYNWGDSIFFVIKSATKNADITFIYSTNTEAAYNESGGKSTYDFNSSNSIRAGIVSFQRPLSPFIKKNIRTYSKRFFEWVNTVSGYSFQYIADVDMDDWTEIQNTKVIVVTGHSEYWTRQARLNFDQFVANGKDAAVFSGNTMWWQVRYSPDKSQLICYKNSSLDPELNPLLKTVNWTETSLQYPTMQSIGVDFIHGAYGMKPYHGWYGYRVLKPNSPILGGLGINFHQIISCQSQELDATLFTGFETNGDPILDTTILGFCKIELIAYDWGKSIYSYGPQQSYGTFIAFQKKPLSGNVVNTAFTNWCSKNGGQGAIGGL